jgi:hypothetical protein
MWESAWVVNKNSQTVRQSSLRGIVRREREVVSGQVLNREVRGKK